MPSNNYCRLFLKFAIGYQDFAAKYFSGVYLPVYIYIAKLIIKKNCGESFFSVHGTMQLLFLLLKWDNTCILHFFYNDIQCYFMLNSEIEIYMGIGVKSQVFLEADRVL